MDTASETPPHAAEPRRDGDDEHQFRADTREGRRHEYRGEAQQGGGKRDQAERARHRAERQAEREALAAHGSQLAKLRRHRAQKLRGELRTRHAAERRALKERLRAERGVARAELREQGIDTCTADALFAFRAASERESLVKRHRDDACCTHGKSRQVHRLAYVAGVAGCGR